MAYDWLLIAILTTGVDK